VREKELALCQGLWPHVESAAAVCIPYYTGSRTVRPAITAPAKDIVEGRGMVLYDQSAACTFDQAVWTNFQAG